MILANGVHASQAGAVKPGFRQDTIGPYQFFDRYWTPANPSAKLHDGSCAKFLKQSCRRQVRPNRPRVVMPSVRQPTYPDQ